MPAELFIPPSSFFLVDLFRRFDLRLGDFERLAFTFNRAEKARFVTFMARCAGLFHLNEQHVAITVESNVLDPLRVAAGFTLHP